MVDVLKAVEILRQKLDASKYGLRRLYNLYYFGVPDPLLTKSSVNIIFGTLNQYKALVYSGDNIILEPRIDNSLDNTPEKAWVEGVLDILCDVIIEDFLNTKSNTVLDLTVMDGLVSGIGYGKIIYNASNWQTPYLIRINPFNIATGYDTLPVTALQQVIYHRTYVTREYFENTYPKKIVNQVYDAIARTKQQEDQLRQDEAYRAIMALDQEHGVYDASLIGTTNRRNTDIIPDELIELGELWYYDFNGKYWVENIVSNNVIIATQSYLVNPFFLA